METDNSLFDHTKRYNIPVEHLDYKYIEKCQNVKELEKILKTLRAGDEGKFPDLEKFCERRLNEVAPQSHILRKSKPLLRPCDIDQTTKKEYTEDLKNWLDEVKSTANGTIFTPEHSIEKTLPPVRQKSGFEASLTPKEIFYSDKSSQNKSGNPLPPSSTSKSNTSSANVPPSNRRVMPRDYNEWAKLERQLKDSDDEAETTPSTKSNSSVINTASSKKNESTNNDVTQVISSRTVLSRPSAPSISTGVSLPPGASGKDRQSMSLREKDKGNEAFHSGDLDEALLYYNRSLSLFPSATVYNNRALVYSKKKMWHEVIKDTTRVIDEEPNNVKALLRRAHALTEIHSLKKAVDDLELVLSIEPNNERAQTLMNNARKEEEKREQSRLVGGRRIAIAEEGSSSDEEDSEEVQTKLLVTEAPKTTPVVDKSIHENGDIVKHEMHDEILIKESNIPSEKENIQNIWNLNEIAAPPKMTESMNAKYESDVNQNVSPFLLAKEKGNEEFKRGNFKAALQHYNKCIELEPENIVGYKNRSLCHLKLQMASDAIYDCNMALEINPDCAQSYFRRGMARKMQGDYADALKDVETAKQYLSNNDNIEDEIVCLRELHKKHPHGERMVEEFFDKPNELIDLSLSQSFVSPSPATGATVETSEPQVSTPVEVESIPSSPEPPTSPDTLATLSDESSSIQLSSSPITKGFEFTQGWNELKSVNFQSKYVAHFLKRITTPSNLPQIISNQLEPDMLERMVTGLGYLMKDSQEHVFVSQFIQHLVKVPRFKMNKLLVPVASMVDLQSILHTLLNGDIISQETYQTIL